MITRVSGLVAAASVVLLTVVGCSQSPQENTNASQIIAKVNGTEIDGDTITALLKFKNVSSQDNKNIERVTNEFLQREGLAQTIETQQVLDSSMIDMEVREFKKQMLIGRYFEQFLNQQVTDQAISNFYQSNADKYKTEAIKVSHILFRTNASMSDVERQAIKTKAHEIFSQLKQGQDFALLAEQYSEDRVSAKKGGDLGWVKRGSISPDFSEQVFSQTVGEYKEPFATEFGFHIAKVTEAAKVQVVPLEKVKGDIRYQLRQQAKQAEMERLQQQVKIERF